MGNSRNHIVIMAGGVGSRLYPLSTPERPKQFLDLTDCGRTLIQQTYDRFRVVDPQAHFWVVTSERYKDLVAEQLPDIPSEQVLLEPMARNTAPCIAYVSWKIALRDPQARVVVCPSDAYIPDYEAFASTIRPAMEHLAAQGSDSIITVGIEPTAPSPEYGYIKAQKGDGIVPVEAFKEKPSVEVARTYLEDGSYYWNAGIFMYRVGTMISELRSHAPGIASLMDELKPSLYTADEASRLALLFPQCEKISIDYAVMEKSDCVKVIPSHWLWSDLGSFEAIEKLTGKKFDFSENSLQ